MDAIGFGAFILGVGFLGAAIGFAACALLSSGRCADCRAESERKVKIDFVA